MVFAPLLVVILLAALAVTPVVIIYGPPEYQLTLDHFRREAGTIAGIARDTISAGGTAIYTSLVVPPFAYLAGMLGAVLSKWATSLVDAVAIYCEEALEFLAFITIFPALFILGDSGFIVFCALNGIGLPGDVVSALIRYGGHLTAAWTTVLSVFEVLSLWHSKAWSRTVESIIWMGYGLMCILRYLGADAESRKLQTTWFRPALLGQHHQFVSYKRNTTIQSPTASRMCFSLSFPPQIKTFCRRISLSLPSLPHLVRYRRMLSSNRGLRWSRNSWSLLSAVLPSVPQVLTRARLSKKQTLKWNSRPARRSL
ncbi:hypothetical protein C8R46DRAFT_1328568 [Mycena filopes]|nr:hypothetical protein C8R46DRAFT_1328568 [Mycena filopes]